MSTAPHCRETVELLTDYLEGLLPLAERDLLEAHLAACPECAEFLRLYRETPRILREATATQMPAELQERLRRFLKEKEPRREAPGD